MKSAVQASRVVVSTRCPLCDEVALDAQTIADGGPEGFEWVRCDCGLIFKRSEPFDAVSADTLGDTGTHYDPEYFRRYARRRRRRVAKSTRQILDALEAAPPGPLLDVGCSLGYALEAARALVLDAYGVDLSSHAVTECRRLGYEAKVGSLDRLPYDDAAFAMVVMKHVFEHTPKPRETLAEIRRVLRPGGAVFFAVPNAGYFKAAIWPKRSRFYRGEAGRSHYVSYTAATLARLLETEGFEVASVHPRLLHRRASLRMRLAEMAALPLRVPLRLLLAAFDLRKEFWMVAVRM